MNDREEEDVTIKPETLEMDALYQAWAIIANVSGGDWTKQPQEWQDAAAMWRDEQLRPLLESCNSGRAA